MTFSKKIKTFNNVIFYFFCLFVLKNEIYFAEKNFGAYFNNQRVRVSQKNDLDDCLFSSDAKGLQTIFPILNIRNSGSAALDLAYVGSGRLDGYFHNNINIWDIAAGIVILKEAGGFVDFFEEDKSSPLKKNILATNTNIHDQLRELIRKKDIE